MFNRIAFVFAGIFILTILGVMGWNWYGEYKDRGLADKHVTELQRDSVALTNAYLVEKNGRLVAEKNLSEADSKAQVSQARFQSSIDQANRRVDRAVATLTATQAKEAADQDVAGVGVVATTVLDTTQNRDYAKLKGKYKVLEDSIPVLHKRIGFLEADNKRLTDENSDLENELNGVYNKVATVRSDVQDEREKARGLFATKRRKVLKEIDKQLSDIRKK